MRNTFCTISRTALKNNLRIIKDFCGDQVKVCAVVKANAYGHGLVPVARLFAEQGADYLAVALAAEGKILRDNGITIPILVMGAIDPNDIAVSIANNLTITASSSEKLNAIAGEAIIQQKTPLVHLKIDTGMGRVGVHWNRSEPFLNEALRLSRAGKIICEGIYTHFSDATDAAFTQTQFDRFIGVVNHARSLGLELPIAHACNSYALLRHPAFHLGMVRPGIALYGIEPELNHTVLLPGIEPALAWKTSVVYFKVVSQDEYVGYGRSWQVKHDPFVRVVTIPVGYADGFPRRLSNCGSVLINGNRYPIVGRVCMDQCMVSIGPTGTAYNGDQVVLIGQSGDAAISVSDIALCLDAAPHEITTCISDRVPRVYVE